jgi:hypothetical protein
MIWKNDFEKINFLVEKSVIELYSELEKSNDYITFLAHGDYIEGNEQSSTTQHIINNHVDVFKDDAWLKVLLTFINSSYNFLNENTCDSKASIFFETMLYLHIWESRPFLRFLKRAANLIEKNTYLWNLKVKDKSKSVYLEQQILPVLEKKKLKIADVIKNGYVKQIRDAIAHNDYWHNLARPELILENYKQKPKRIEKIHYNEWTNKFCYTFLLAFHLRKYFEIKKQNLDDKKCKEGFEVKLKDKNGETIDGLILYDKESNKFQGRIISRTANKNY